MQLPTRDASPARDPVAKYHFARDHGAHLLVLEDKPRSYEIAYKGVQSNVLFKNNFLALEAKSQYEPNQEDNATRDLMLSNCQSISQNQISESMVRFGPFCNLNVRMIVHD